MERLKPGADKAKVDARIWDLFGEQWAVMFTDLSGFSRKTAEFGIIHFLQVIFESERILIPIIDKHDGILLKTDGDSLLIIFRRTQKAIECAIEMQQTLKVYNKSLPEEEKILLCLGIGFGPMLRIGDRDVFGPEVNAASKLGEDIAKQGEILVTEGVKKNLELTPAHSFEPITEIPPGASAAFRLRYTL
ncbi:MAG: adenylate cyclase [Bdellovibrionales bacterium GWA2_49_15]|nr:MAG: adenylate cyclase [Bdellovibrionales bacterium GWA2_49_15]HAZ14087.1 adenylate cyclase [Bdellovibrionales bacterium]